MDVDHPRKEEYKSINQKGISSKDKDLNS